MQKNTQFLVYNQLKFLIFVNTLKLTHMQDTTQFTINQKFDFLTDLTSMVVNDITPSLIVTGEGGLGKTHSVKDFVEKALEILDLSLDIEKYVEFDKQHLRPSEVDSLIGDTTKAKKILKWHAKTNFHKLIEIMVENDLKIESSI